MLTLMRGFLCLAVSLSLAGACAGQNPGKSKSSSRKAKPRTVREPVEVSVIVPDAAVETEVRQVGAAQVSYIGPPADSTVVSVDLPEVYRERGRAIDLNFNFELHGREVVRPDKVRVDFFPDAGSFKAARLLLEADGRRFSFNITRVPGAPEVLPQTVIDFPTFEQIANSKSVKGSVGRLTFELTERHLEALRDLLRTIEAPAKKP
jgi:hypothetical protein